MTKPLCPPVDAQARVRAAALTDSILSTGERLLHMMETRKGLTGNEKRRLTYEIRAQRTSMVAMVSQVVEATEATRPIGRLSKVE